MAGRIAWLDGARGVAILLMIFYHFFFDLDFLGILRMPSDAFWFFLPRFIGSLFLLIVGISMTLSEARDKGYMHHAKRGLKLAAIALAITLATWVYPHEGFIQFGIIHLIALSTFVAPFFFRFGKLNVLLGLLMIVGGIWAQTLQAQTHLLFWLGIADPGYTALDSYPLLPWFGFVLIGIYAGQTLFPAGRAEPAKPVVQNSAPIRALSFLGKNSLAIYLAHQPVMLGLLMLGKMIF